MYCKWVTVPLGDSFEVRVFIATVPEATDDENLTLAREMLRHQLERSAVQ